MPKIDGKTRNRLLLHQMMAGLPSEINKQLRPTSEAKDLDETIRRARLLLSNRVGGTTCGLGLGLFQFRCMPFGLTGAPGSVQRLMNKGISANNGSRPHS